jgi:hypothetical protein
MTPFGMPVEPDVKSSIAKPWFWRRKGGKDISSSVFSHSRNVATAQLGSDGLKSSPRLIKTSGWHNS